MQVVHNAENKTDQKQEKSTFQNEPIATLNKITNVL